MERLKGLLRRYPLLAVVVVAGVVWGYVTWSSRAGKAVVPVRERTQALPPIQTAKALQAADWLNIQQKQVEQERKDKELERLLHQVVQTQEQQQRAWTQQSGQQRQELEAKLHTAFQEQTQHLAQQLQRAKQEAKPDVKPVAKQTVKPTPLPPHPLASSSRPAAILEMKESMQTSTPFAAGGAPLPDAARADTAYLPAGSLAEVKLISGVFATARAGWGRDLIVSVAQPFHPPRRLGGPDQPSSRTSVDLSGCYLIGMAEGDLGSGRVYAALHTLSCILPDLTTVEQPIKGVLLGMDKTLGLVGRVETRDSAYLGRMALASAMSGAAEAFALTKRQVIVTPFGGTTSVTTGSAGELAGASALAKATADLSKFYLQQAERLLPTLWVEAGARGAVALKEGLTLEGYPTKVVVAHGGGR